ncbi:MAG: HU family DNA-binding protein [Acidobacteria bacterium]|nr:HU family DNA-binding protein [Acidobacteriota bacterium]
MQDQPVTGGTLTKAALLELVADVADVTKKCAEVIVETVFRSIAESLCRGEKVELRGFGSFPGAVQAVPGQHPGRPASNRTPAAPVARRHRRPFPATATRES